MGNTKTSSLEGLIKRLRQVNDRLWRLRNEVQERLDAWYVDGDNKHSDICYKRFVRIIGQFYAVQNLICAAKSKFIKRCYLRESMDELASELEHYLSMALQARQKYQQDRKSYELQTKFGGGSKDEDEPFDDAIEHLQIDDEKLEGFSIGILCLENHWLRQQKRPAKLIVPNTEPTDTEGNIIEALADGNLRGPELSKKAGYENNSHMRQILSNLVKRGILSRNDKGYFKS